MKILEQRINKLLSIVSPNLLIENWEWVGAPLGECPDQLDMKGLYAVVDRIIQQADQEQCFISPSKYIREYRKYYESRKTDR